MYLILIASFVSRKSGCLNSALQQPCVDILSFGTCYYKNSHLGFHFQIPVKNTRIRCINDATSFTSSLVEDSVVLLTQVL